MKKKTLAIIISASVVGTLALAVAIPFSILGIRTAGLSASYAYLKDDPQYSAKAEVAGLDLVTQHVSCGYASIEMLSTYYGNKVTEDELDARNKGGVSTSSSKGFHDEVNRSIPSKKFVMHTYLKHDAMLKEIHTSLTDGHPVAIEWAAKYGSEWTLHFSIVSAIDIANDEVTVYNPYGYVEEVGLSEFISRTSFEAYKNMPLFLGFGFAFGAFDKNAIFYAK